MGNIFSKDEESSESGASGVSKPMTSPRLVTVPSISRKIPRPEVFVGKIGVSVIKGKLTDQEADVIVNSTNCKLKLSDGRASKAMLNAAGASIQTDCDNKYPNGIKYGDYAITGPGKLHCKEIYHACLPKYEAGTANEKVLHDLAMKCLEGAEKTKKTSIAFPGFGTGFLGYPSKNVAQIIFKCIEEFDKKHTTLSLQKVLIVIFYLDEQIFDDFKHEAINKSKQSQGPQPSGQWPREPSVCTFGNVKLQLKTGGLAQEKVDVIVNSTVKSLKLESGGLSKSLLENAGSKLQDEVDSKYKNGIKYGDIAETGGYNLKCCKVYHGCIPSWYGKTGITRPDQILGAFVTKCLEEASSNRMKSIAFPALGTGFLKFPPNIVASNMVECVRDFQQKYPQTTLREIRIIVQPQLTEIKQAFQSEMATSCTQVVVAAISHVTHKKGSKGYYQAKYMEEQRPPSYWTTFHPAFTLKEWNIKVSTNKHNLCAVDKNTQDAITNLFKQTWTGSDAVPTIKKIERVESLSLFEKYSHERQRVFRKVADNKNLKFESPDKMSGAGGCILTTKFVNSVLNQDLYPEINEHYFFHGTKVSLVDSIVGQGMDSRLSSNGSFGTGVYGAENSVKSNVYTDESSSGMKKMFLVRMCLGQIYYSPNRHMFCRPPCQKCLQERCNAHNEFFDSVMGTAITHREFIVYDNSQCYPEYLITYSF